MSTAPSPNPNGNPFDIPLNSEIQESQQRQQASQSSSDNGNPFDEPLASEVAEAKHSAASASQTGELTNDVGQKVIVPKDGESFSDTIKRAVAYHNSLTTDQQQAAMGAEAKTIPAKTAQTLGAAAGLGVVGPALLAVPGELGELAIKHLAGNVLPGMEETAARAKLAEMAPKALQIVKEWALPVSAVGGLLKILTLGGSKH
jgi:hypothetical protein